MNLKRFLVVAVTIIAFGFVTVDAQQMPSIPTDPNVRIGKLSNGLTYYIRKNSLPEDKAYFYIAQKVGSIQEEKDQRGLAHFLEHMCFNGSKHFPGNKTISYLETIGVKFGENLNAYTSVDETVYNIDNVPVKTPGAIDSCLLMLHDWSHDLTLDPVEIDKERGVIQGEWRMSRDAGERLFEQYLPVVMKGCKYDDCSPIGTMDVVMHFKPQTLRNYYEKWYRPDLQAIVVVGDINPDEIETKIKNVFNAIPVKKNATPRVYYAVPDNHDPIVFIGKDKELTNIGADIMFKRRSEPDSLKSNMAYYMENYVISSVNYMINQRLNEITQKSTAPFAGASAGDGKYIVARDERAFSGSVTLKESNIKEGFAAIYREMLRAKRHGFTSSEYERTRIEILRQYESAYNEREKQESNTFVNEYVRNFLDKEPIPSIEQEYAIINEIAPKIPVEAINQMMDNLMPDSNMVIMYTTPEKEGLAIPTQKDLLDIISQVNGEKIEAYVDKVSNEPLMKTLPKPGKINSEKKNKKNGTVEMALSNGAKVVVKTTDFKKDEISLSAVSKGGTSLYPDSEALNLAFVTSVSGVGGVGNFSQVDLQKVLAGKMANASSSVSSYTESIGGACSPKDLETMMQLVYLKFTAPRKDVDAFESYKNRLKVSLKNEELEPNTSLRDTMSYAMYCGSPRAKRTKEADVDKINYDRILQIYKERFGNASDFTFFIVGNATADTLRPFIEKYIASLPTTGMKESYKVITPIRKGVYTSDFLKDMETPSSTIIKMMTVYEKYNLRNAIVTDIYSQVLNSIALKTIREDASISYAPGASASLNSTPTSVGVVYFSVPTSPDKKEQALKMMNEAVAKIEKEGPDDDNFEKAKEYLVKGYTNNLKENSYWSGVMITKWLTGEDVDTNYVKVVKSITKKEVQMFAAELAKQNNVITVTMTSKEKNK